MHREFDPDDLEHMRQHAFEASGGHSHHHDPDEPADDHRRLYGLTALLGALIGLDLILGWLGLERWRAPFGLSLVWIAALFGSARIIYGALDGLLNGKIGADLALAQASVAALVLGEPFVAAEVVFIAMFGEVLEALTFARAQRAIHRLVDQSPRTARVVRDGEEIEVAASAVLVGNLVRIGQGERIPVDGLVTTGRSSVDQSSLTGEAIPVDKGPGDKVFTGTVNQFGQIEVVAEKVGHETTFGQVLELVASARKKKSSLERAADRYARYFLPVVEVVALLTVLSGFWIGWGDAWRRAVAVLVVACPCALVLATPAAMLAAMAWLARHGIIIKGGAALERLASCDTFAFDKTGTLTAGKPEVARTVVFAPSVSPSELVRLAATAESGNPHPLGRLVLSEAARLGVSAGEAEQRTALPGAGVSATIRREDGGTSLILVGNRRLLEEHGIFPDPDVEAALRESDETGETALLVAIDGRVVGLITARDVARREAREVVRDLARLKISEVAILTGDREGAARRVAGETLIETVEAGLLPADKARWIGDRQDAGRNVAMVGDGINDAPALAVARVGIALAGVGSDLAAEAGDILILGEPLSTLPGLVRLSRATMAVIRQNILIFAFGLNASAIAAAAFGWLGPVPAAILHQAGSVLVLLNAMRLLSFEVWPRARRGTLLASLRGAFRRFDDGIDLELFLEFFRRNRRRLATAVVLLGILSYGISGWRVIGPDEVGIVRRFGGVVAVRGPGLSPGWPWPIEEVTRQSPDRVESVAIGFRVASVGPDPGEAAGWENSHSRGGATTAIAAEESLILTGDGQLVEITADVQYRLPSGSETLTRLTFGVTDLPGAIRSVGESSLRSVVGQRRLDSVLTSGREETERLVASELQRRLDGYGLTVRVACVAFRDAHPPVQVVDAYRDLSRASSDRERRIIEGATVAERQARLAGSQAAEIRHRAEGRADGAIQRARGQSDAFRQRIAARAGFGATLDSLLYLDRIRGILAGRSKVILEPGQGRRQLILPDAPGLSTLIPPPGSSLEEIGPPSPGQRVRNGSR